MPFPPQRTLVGAGCRVYHSANQSLTSGSPTALAFNSERYDTHAFHDTSTNNTRLTIPTGMAGKYHLWAGVEIAANADANRRQVYLRLNGATALAAVQLPSINSASFATQLIVACLYDLAAGDYVEVVVTQQSGSALNVLAAGNYSPEFSLARVG